MIRSVVLLFLVSGCAWIGSAEARTYPRYGYYDEFGFDQWYGYPNYGYIERPTYGPLYYGNRTMYPTQRPSDYWLNPGERWRMHRHGIRRPRYYTEGWYRAIRPSPYSNWYY